MKKLDSRGISHFVVPLLVVLLVAVAGTFALVSSHADSNSVPVSTRCKKGLTMVNAKPADYIKGKLKNSAIRGHGLVCVKNPSGREQVNSPNFNTISANYKCPSNSTFAYDRNNPDGTGFNVKWKIKSHFGGQVGGVKTYYCIKTKDLYVNMTPDGVHFKDSKKQLLKPGNYQPFGDKHTYHFYPAYDLRDGCNADEYKHTACRKNYFFSYYFTQDQGNHL